MARTAAICTTELFRDGLALKHMAEIFENRGQYQHLGFLEQWLD
jgi:hypothetical protein